MESVQTRWKIFPPYNQLRELLYLLFSASHRKLAE